MKQRLINHYLAMFMLVLVAGSILYLIRGNRNAITFVAFASGYISLTILSFSLILGPIRLMKKQNNPVSTYFRRDISIIGGTLALIHSVSGLFVHLRGKTWLYFLNKTEAGYSVRMDDFGLANYSGLLSALFILLLLATSNDNTLIKMKQGNWKNIQRLSYLLFILALIHCYYYRTGNKNLDIIWYFYIPVIVIVLAFQATGVWLRLRKK